MPAAGDGYLNQFLWLDQSCYLPDDILHKCDRMSMAHVLRGHAPVRNAPAPVRHQAVQARQLSKLCRSRRPNQGPAISSSNLLTVFQFRAVMTRCRRFSDSSFSIFDSITPLAHPR